MEDRKSFVFYETFLQQVSCLPSEQQGKYLHAIIEYGLYGKEPNYTGAELGMWLGIKFGIDNAKERRKFAREIGSKGGKNKKINTVKQRLSDATNNSSDATEMLSDAQADKDTLNLKVNLNGNVNVNDNDNVNGNVNVNDKVNLKASTDDGGSLSILTSDIIHDHLHDMGYEVHLSSCGMIASILNKEKLPLEYCEFVENKVSDKYPEISAGLMVNALTTWIELFEEFRKSQKQKEKKKEKLLTHCAKCGSELSNLNWINGSNTAYFCCTCDSNFVRKNGEWREEKEL